MKNTINYSSYSGVASELCTQGDAVEFLQPWYTPISTTPENTGLAVGGIGSTFTLTPEGKTPNFSFIPGVFIDCSDQYLNFNDFFVSSMDLPSLDNLKLKSIDEVNAYLEYYPAQFNSLILPPHGKDDLLEKIKSSLRHLNFYQDNKEQFVKWHIDFSDKTHHALRHAPQALMTQILVAIDFFDGLLINDSVNKLSLTANHESCVPAINSEHIHYQALYPMAEYRYTALNGINVVRKVVSPIVKEDKKLCSLPLHWNHFEFTNTTDTTKIVTLVQPLENLIGSTYRKGRDGVQDSFCTLTKNPIDQLNESIELTLENEVFKGAKLISETTYGADIEGEINYGAVVDKQLLESGKVCVSIKPSIYSSLIDKQLINALETGRTSQHFDRGIYSGRESLTSLVCIQVELAANESIDFRMAQVMDHNKISFKGWQSEKAYKQFYPYLNTCHSILSDVLPQLSNIEQRIITQQTDFHAAATDQMSNESIALQFSTMAMNTLSFLAESTVWSRDDQFLVKECVDYPFFNSLDVYFYGSFSLLYLLPELDGCVMKDFSKAILASDDTKRRYWKYQDKPYAELEDPKYEGVRAVSGAVIHDLGSPYDIQPDAYNWHNVKEWKDLAPKYILMVYRHYQHSKDIEVVKACWPAITTSIELLSDLIEPGDTLPLTRGTDDTFDNLASHGISVYCASLWAAGLKVASTLASLMSEDALASDYMARSNAALATLESGLWDEQKGYYHFYVTPIQTKHLTGRGFESLSTIGLDLSGNTLADKEILNAYLDCVVQNTRLTKLEQRTEKKKQLLTLAPEAFTEEYATILLDSDNSFGDVLLADSYLKLMGIDGLFSDERINRTLDYIYTTNFIKNSPTLGVANMTLSDGQPHEAFQAQDVWIGVQFSVATSLHLAGKIEQAETLISTVYNALYHYAKIPFAAPEGFNCSVPVSIESIMAQFNLPDEIAINWFKLLTNKQCLLNDGRVTPYLTKDLTAFSQLVTGVIDESKHAELHKWLLNTGLKYTAGRYFRPGMIFAYLLNQAC
ncbi:GH116 family glycosyl hydrolase [Psychromonas sp. PT13]|uniref:GH116 family glycosyl hydrolase n=1 Tax=Psychromonas sp. PT13 TaxID=3439547 RepID=UPI003EBC455C